MHPLFGERNCWKRPSRAFAKGKGCHSRSFFLDDLLQVRRATIEDCAVYQAAMAPGFEGSVELFSPFSSPSVLGAPRMTACLAKEQGIAVGTGFGVLTGDRVGIFNVTTHPDYRRRGYGRAMIETVLQDAYSAGARAGLSFMGLQTRAFLYESVGSSRAENWTASPSSSPCLFVRFTARPPFRGSWSKNS